VCLHGYGDDPAGLAATGTALDPTSTLLVPTGPVDAGGRPAWFASGPADRGPPLVTTLDALDALIDATCETHHLDPSDTAVLGYSQGAAAALALAFRVGARRRPAHVVVHAAWLLDEPDVDWALAEGGATRALLTHGRDDDVVPVQQGRSAARVLERHGVDATFVEIDAGHDLGHFPVDEAARWLAS
jgi:phospholipase/carboxylesterase